MTWTRKDVVVATDPFKDHADSGRPFLIINGSETPFRGEQYITLALTTRTWYSERIKLQKDDWIKGGAPESSSIMPWSLNSIKTNWIDYRQGRLKPEKVEEAVETVIQYIK